MAETLERLWSVTTLLSQGVPKPALVGWAANVTAEYALDNLDMLATVANADRPAALELLKKARWRTSSEAAARGIDVHRAAEAFAYGETPEVDEALAGYVQQYQQFLRDHEPEFLAAEAPVYNRTYHYAGTLDAIVRVDGRVCVLDMKTTAKAPGGGARPPYPEIALQLVAYARAEYLGLAPASMRTYSGRRYYVWEDDQPHAPMPETEGALALVVSPHDYTLTPVRVDEEIWQSWLYVREVARWTLETSQRVLGPQVAPARKETV